MAPKREIGSLSKGIYKWHMSTGGEAFSLTLTNLYYEVSSH